MKLGTARACGLAFLTAAVTLFTQILVHRMVSAKLLNNFAFLVISLTMLGFALSGVILTRALTALLARLADAVAACAALFTLTLLGASHIFYRADIGQFPASRGEFVLTLLQTLPLALLFAIPFVFCGLVLGALLSTSEFPTRGVYLADLVGSGAGALAVIPAISGLGVEQSTLLACAAFLAGSLLLAPPARVGPRLLAAAAAVALLASAAFRETVFDLSYPTGTMLKTIQALPEPFKVEYVRWDPVARIEVSRVPPPDPAAINYPCLIGDDHAFHARFKRMLTQNNFAFTFAVEYDGTPESLRGIEQTIYAAAYETTSVARPKVAIIGIGGGFDVLTALRFDASRIEALEVNAATVGILKDVYRSYFGSWVQDPRVDLVFSEGRLALTRSSERFDVLQLSGVDSYSGTAAAAHIFSESYLYTSEAFDLYLSRLTEGGILNMMRLEGQPPREMLRALVTAVGALRRAGVRRPADHIVMLTAKPTPNFAALLVKRSPFTTEELRRVGDWAAGSRYFAVSAAPDIDASRSNNYQRFLSLGDPRLEAAFVASAPVDISPVDDDRPFFFKYSTWIDVLGPRSALPVMEDTVLILTGIIGLVAVLCIMLPLAYLTRHGARTPDAWRYGAYFAGTAVGYMAAEIALLQKFGLFLGHPNHALSVVLAALLVSSGVGSLLSGWIVGALGQVRFVSYALAAVILAEYLLALPRLPGLMALPFAARAAIVCALVTPIGICLGTFLPSALEQLKPRAPAYVPWAWGLNGIFSVLAPVLSVAFSMTWGIGALLLAAIPVYLAVGFVLPCYDLGLSGTPEAALEEP